VGRTYAVQPGRGKPAVARFKLLELRCERVTEISAVDAIKEGCPSNLDSPIGWYIDLWDAINPDEPFDSNPEVWVLEFELVEDNNDG